MRAAALLPWLLGLALALETSGSLEVRLEGRYAGGVFALEPVYAGSLLASEAWGGLLAEAALYPRWNLATQDIDAGISKLELSYGAPGYALGAGASPEPTAVLRLLSLFPLALPRPDFAPGLSSGVAGWRSTPTPSRGCGWPSAAYGTAPSASSAQTAGWPAWTTS